MFINKTSERNQRNIVIKTKLSWIKVKIVNKIIRKNTIIMITITILKLRPRIMTKVIIKVHLFFFLLIKKGKRNRKKEKFANTKNFNKKRKHNKSNITKLLIY
jgi:hypothetical protein